jgi:hypothetical protein
MAKVFREFDGVFLLNYMPRTLSITEKYYAKLIFIKEKEGEH